MTCLDRILVAALVALSPALAAAEERSCAVSRLSGVGIETEGPAGWAELQGAAIPAGTVRLRTDGETRAEIACSDGVTVTIGTGTVIDLVGLAGPAGGDRDILLRLTEGIVGIVAPVRTWAGFAVETPLAIASIRSTEWLVESGTETGTAVFVRKGVVDVAAGDARFGLQPTEGITVPPSGQPGPVKVWGAERIAAAGRRIGFGWE